MNNILKEQFENYIRIAPLDVSKANAIIDRVENSLLAFLQEKFQVKANSIFDLQDVNALKGFKKSIETDEMLLLESSSYAEVSITEALFAYCKFLENITSIPTTPVLTSEPSVQGPDESEEEETELSRQVEQHTQQEGAVLKKTITYRDRNRTLRAACIDYYRNERGRIVCQCCGFDFEEHYGDLGKDFIEVHHIQRIADTDGIHEVNPEEELIPLCSNCHSMIHHGKNGVMMPEELKKIYNEHNR